MHIKMILYPSVRAHVFVCVIFVLAYVSEYHAKYSSTLILQDLDIKILS
jgi:hypothetical protein